jgi:hypothetical protein
MIKFNLQRKGAKAQRRNGSSADFQVCGVAGFQTCRRFSLGRLADLEIGDTAGLETCATTASPSAFAPLRLCVKSEVLR